MGTQYNLNTSKLNAPSPSARNGQVGPTTNRWLTQFLESKAFLKLPAKNLQILISQLQEINIAGGETLISAGQSANFYYIIKQGSLELAHQQQTIATLHAGDGFGEDLLSDNAQYIFDVIAKTDSMLMRLPRDSFVKLLVSSVLESVPIQAYTDKNVILDSNSQALYEAPNVQHIPYAHIRSHRIKLNKKLRYIITHSDIGLRSASAFTLNQLGYNAAVMVGELTLPKPDSTSSVQENSNLESDLAELENQIKSLETLTVEPSAVTKPNISHNTTIVCVDRDDEQLWTPIPAGRTPEELAVLETRKKKNSASTKDTGDTNWLSDDYVWEKILGFDSTPDVDTLLEQESQARKPEGHQQKNKTPSTSCDTKFRLVKDAPTADARLVKPHQTSSQQQYPPHRSVIKNRSKPYYAATVILAAAIAAAPFIAPNSWHKFYSHLNTAIDSSTLIQTISGLSNFSTSTKEDSEAPSKVTLLPSQQKLLAFEHVRSQAEAEFARKLTTAKPVAPTPENFVPPAQIPTIPEDHVDTNIDIFPPVIPLTNTSISPNATDNIDTASLLGASHTADVD